MFAPVESAFSGVRSETRSGLRSFLADVATYQKCIYHTRTSTSLAIPPVDERWQLLKSRQFL